MSAVFESARFTIDIEGLAMTRYGSKKFGSLQSSGVADLRRAHELKLSQGIVAKFLGATPEEAPERYPEASPMERVPVRKPVVLIHGEEDKIVPIEIARGYAEAARKAGGKVELVVVPGGHFEVIDPGTEQWGGGGEEGGGDVEVREVIADLGV